MCSAAAAAAMSQSCNSFNLLKKEKCDAILTSKCQQQQQLMISCYHTSAVRVNSSSRQEQCGRFNQGNVTITSSLDNFLQQLGEQKNETTEL